MKKLAFAIIALSVLTACQPKDQGMITPLGGSNNSPKAVAMNQTENYQLLALSIDRLGEVLHLVKATLNPVYAQKSGLVQEEKDRATASPFTGSRFLKSPKDIEHKGEGRKAKTNLNYEIESLKTDANGKVTLLVLVKSGSEFKSQGFLGDTDFASTNKSGRITIQPASEDGIYVLKAERLDDTGSKKDKASTIKTLFAQTTFVWDGTAAGLEQAVRIVKVNLEVKRDGAKSGSLALIGQSEDLQILLGACVSINGKISFTPFVEPKAVTDKEEKMVNPPATLSSVLDVDVVDSNVQIQASQFVSSAVKECVNRPVVDLSRML